MSDRNVSLPFRFSLRDLLVAMTVVALVLGLCVFPGGRVVVGIILTLLVRGVLPTVAVVAAIYGRGNLRAFGIGAAVSCLPMVTGQIDLWSVSFSRFLFVAFVQLLAAPICGGVAAMTRNWIHSRQRSEGG